jgi:hypothetical protein
LLGDEAAEGVLGVVFRGVRIEGIGGYVSSPVRLEDL